ncbi:hypothetical protein QNN00_16050 [Bacillus velezensis]|nr:hypothetical protein [Bacillus velezensis]
MSRNPLFDAMFILQNMEREEINLAGLKASRSEHTEHDVSVLT